MSRNIRPNELQPLPGPLAGPRRSSPPAGLLPSRGRIGLILAIGALPVAILAESLLGFDSHIVFAGLWLAAAISQVSIGREPWDWLALSALGLYAISFALPANVAPNGSVTGDPLGYQVFAMPPVGPLPKLPPGELVATIVGLSAWLANPCFLMSLALYRYREPTVAMVIAAAAVAFGFMSVPASNLGGAQLAWLAAPTILAFASRWARSTWA